MHNLSYFGKVVERYSSAKCRDIDDFDICLENSVALILFGIAIHPSVQNKPSFDTTSIRVQNAYRCYRTWSSISSTVQKMEIKWWKMTRKSDMQWKKGCRSLSSLFSMFVGEIIESRLVDAGKCHRLHFGVNMGNNPVNSCESSHHASNDENHCVSLETTLQYILTHTLSTKISI